MALNVKFPALVEAIPPRARVKRKCALAFDMEVAPIKAGLGDAPVAIQYTDYNIKTPRQYRLFEDKLYVRDHMGLERYLERATNYMFDHRSGPFARVARDIADEVQSEHNFNSSHLWPSQPKFDLKHALSRGMYDQSPVFKEIVENSLKFVLDDEAERQVEYWRSRASAEIEKLVLFDGELWVRSSEPCLVASRNDDGYDNFFVKEDSDDYRRLVDRKQTTSIWRGHTDVFGLDQSQLILDNASRRYSPLRHEKGMSIDIFIPEALKADFDRLETERRTREMCELFADALGNEDIEATPSAALVAAWADLCDLVDSYDPSRGTPESLGEAAAVMLDAVRRDPDGHRFLHYRMQNTVEFAIERFESRRITPSHGASEGYRR